MTRRSRWVRLNSRENPILDRCPACGDELGRGDKSNHFEEHDPADFGLSREAVLGVGLGADHSPNVVVTDGGRVCSECGERATTRTDDGQLVCDEHDPSGNNLLLVTDGGEPLNGHWERCEIPDCRNRVLWINSGRDGQEFNEFRVRAETVYDPGRGKIGALRDG